MHSFINNHILLMTPISPLPALIALLAAIITALFIAKLFGISTVTGRFSTIDGLRGYLAFFVFIHHSCVWYYYLHTGNWYVPPSNLYTNFGQSSVLLFFMITGFLFFSKILKGRSTGIDWLHLYISRILRLTPLYMASMIVFFSLIVFVSGGDINESIANLFIKSIRWLSFTILGSPNINGVIDTPVFIAKVTWTLRYEWYYYFSLPLIALLLKVKTPLICIIFSILCCCSMFLWHPQFHLLLAFGSGMVAALLTRIKPLCKLVSNWAFSILCSFCILITLIKFPTSYGYMQLILLTIAFISIACGNDLFGILSKSFSRLLGEISYGLYLLHGLVLYITIQLIIGHPQSLSFSAVKYWSIIVILTPILVIICYATFRYIEKPFMNKATIVTNWIRSYPIIPIKAYLSKISAFQEKK